MLRSRTFTLLLADLNPNLLFVAGAALVVVMLMRWKRRHPRREAPSPTADPMAAARAGAALPASLDNWEVRMHDLSRDLSGQLDTKICIVQELLKRAEEQTARLEAALRRVDELAKTTNRPEDAPNQR